jgi:hypothetical protein
MNCCRRSIVLGVLFDKSDYFRIIDNVYVFAE